MRNKTMKAKVLIATVCIGAFASGVYAQQGGTAGQNPTSTKGAVVKGKAPVNKNLLTVKLPKEQEATLKNGLHVVLLESNHMLPIFSMELVVMSGGFSDPADMRGLANMTALLMREGTAKHNSRELGEALDTIGASFGANSGVSSFTSNITASGLTDNLDQILDLYAEIIRTPKYPTEEVERYRSRTLDSQPQLRANPGFLAQERLAQAIYGTHPASLTFAPPDAIKKITVADLMRFHDQNYVPNNATLYIAGDVTLKEMLPKIEKLFGDWKQGEVKQPTLPPVPAQAETKIHLINRPGSVQTVFQIGSLSLERTSPDYVAMRVMNQILGTGPPSRLFLNIREDKGYTYSPFSTIQNRKGVSIWYEQADVTSKDTGNSLQEIAKEIRKLQNEAPPKAELEGIQRYMAGTFVLQNSNSGGIVSQLNFLDLHGLDGSYLTDRVKNIYAVTPEKVSQITKDHFKYEDMTLVLVGDKKLLEKQIKQHEAAKKMK